MSRRVFYRSGNFPIWGYMEHNSTRHCLLPRDDHEALCRESVESGVGIETLILDALRARFTDEVVLRAADPDNERERRQIVELLTDQYGSDECSRWYSSAPAGSESIRDLSEHTSSLVVMVGNHMIAHIAFRYSWRSGAVEILRPAVARSAKREILLISRLFNTILLRQAAKQGWRTVYHFAETYHPITEFIATKCFSATGVAIIAQPLVPYSAPRELCGLDQARCRGGLVLMVRLFRPPVAAEREFNPPARHRRFIVEQYHTLTDHILHNPPSLEARVNEEPDRPLPVTGAEIIEYPDVGLYELRIFPSSLRSSLHLAHELSHLGELAHDRGCYTAVTVALEDPLCADFDTTLAALGYRFSGIAPTFSRSYGIVYTRYRPESLCAMTLYHPLAQKLRSYMLSQETNSRTLVQHG